MKTVADVEQRLRNEMAQLAMPELKRFALDMGVQREDVTDFTTRAEIEDRCIAIEQYAFVH
jgi:hypothetical protein